MTFDGVDACFLYPSQRTMFFFMGNEDREFHLAGVQAYNNWLAQEFCSVDPERLFGLAQMPNLGVQSMIDEMKRCKQLGFRGVIISTWPSGEDDLSEKDDPFFAAAQELGMPVSHPHPHPAQAQSGGRAQGRRPRSATWRSPACCCSRRS